jgi:DNA-binding CsgD family transcriptional regulator
MAERGVRLRTLYQHTARSHLATQAYARHVTKTGGEVRTVDEIFERLVIFDDDLAFIPQLAPGERRAGAVVVSDPSIVAFLRRLYDHVWETAIPFTPMSTEATMRMDKVHLAVARLLGGGHTDEVIARRLGMSPRTCRRYIAELHSSLGSSSRFQAGAAAARLGLLDIPDASEQPPAPTLE